MTFKSVLVTGSAGFIGAALSNYLLNRGYKVIGIDNLNSYYDVQLKKANPCISLTASGNTQCSIDTQFANIPSLSIGISGSKTKDACSVLSTRLSL